MYNFRKCVLANLGNKSDVVEDESSANLPNFEIAFGEFISF